MKDIEIIYRDTLKPFLNKRVIVSGVVERIGRGRRTGVRMTQKTSVRVTVKDLFLVKQKKNLGYYVNIFIYQDLNLCKGLEIGKKIVFEGVVKEYRTYKYLLKNCPVKIKNIGINEIKLISIR